MERDTEHQESANLSQTETEGNREELPRQSKRTHIITEKMLAYQKDECCKKEKRLNTLYEQWKKDVRKARHDLKSNISDKQLTEIADSLENKVNCIMKIFSEIREHITPVSDLRRKIDACEAVTNDIVKIVLERLTMFEDEFDAERERSRLQGLSAHSYARSIYDSSASQASVSSYSRSSSATSKQADAVAELAAKEAEYKMMHSERQQREKIRALEEQHKRELEIQKFELERMQLEKDLEVARARVKAYGEEAKGQLNLLQNEHESERNEISPATHPQYNVVRSTTLSEVSHLAQAVQDSIAINRLPTPEPTVFNGDPIQFVNWKASFMSLIDRKGISAADKLYYLKRYVSGSAHRCLEGTFYRNDEESYKDAWNKLNQRYGQPFIIQRAFREKLSKWPRIQSKDAEGLRAFSDFLNACLQAIPHVKGLEILNDCEENQKLIQKLPDWAASRWNRQVTISLMDGKEFPTFKDFVKFMSTEAEIVCNPITSFHALHLCESQKDTKRNKAIVLKTQTTLNNDKQTTAKEQLKVPCMLCQDDNHPLCKCPIFMQKSLKDRRAYVKDNRLCYGCIRPGHCAKECRRRHTCEVCKLRHPTCLHDYSYKTNGDRKQSLSTVSNTHVHDGETTSAMSLNITSASHSVMTSMIVPVWVSSVKNPSNEQLVYALLDTQSDSTFIDEEISNRLQVDTHPIKLKLTTMIGDTNIIKSKRVSNLRVRGYNSSVFINLPPVYTKECIPINYDHIPTQETASNWTHLKVITNEMPPLLSCEVGLLIGYNCPRVLAPRQVILGKEDEPYAILTDLGWSIVGCFTPSTNVLSAVSLCHRLTTKEITALTPVDGIRILESDFKDVAADDQTILQDDIAFLDKLKGSINKNVVLELPVGDPEVRKIKTLQTKTTESRDLVDHLSKFSSWSKAVKAIARLLRRIRKDKTNSPASVSEQEDAKRLILKGVQKQIYQKEIDILSQGKQLPGHNKLHHLDSFLDTDGIIKVGGRLNHSSCIHSFKHPLILPKDHHITRLIIAHYHESVKHQGKGFTINEIRSCGYWIPGINRAVTSHIRNCVTCRKLRKSVEGQRMSDLPKERVEASPPFVYCGMDCFGPFMTKEGRKQHKRYGLLLTCFCSRAIHIEMLEDMSTDAFINSLRCFIAIRGTGRQITCDQGSNFIGAKNELNSALKELDSERLTAFLADKQCDFVMNAPHSSHAGGVWERQIKTVRSVLNATVSLSSGRLNDASLRTLFYEAMAIVNSRPLTVDNLNDPKSLEPLTPNHLITMKSTKALPPPGEFVREDLYGKKRWRRVQYLTEQLWSRWKKEYLLNIAARQCWHATKRNFQIGDVVMDADDNLPRNEWRLGRIIDTAISPDGLIRTVTIVLGDKTLSKKGERINKTSVVERPVKKLILLLEAD